MLIRTPRELNIDQFYFSKDCYKISQTVVPPGPQLAQMPFVIRLSSFSNDGVISAVLPEERGFLFWLLYLFSIANNKKARTKNSI